MKTAYLLALAAGCSGTTALGDAPSASDARTSDSAAPIDGAPAEDAPQGHVLAPSSAAFAITLDDTAIYWTDTGAQTVSSIPIAGGTATTLATGVGQPYYLAHDGSSLYWGLSNDQIAKIPLAGGTPLPLQTSNNTVLTGLAVDATNVYHLEDYTVPQDCSVVAHPTGGGTRMILASGGSWDQPTAIAVSGGTVYWGVVNPGAILSVPATGGTTSTVASGIAPIAIAADATNLYWSDGSGAIMKVAQGGGTPITLATSANARSIAVDDTYVYWSTSAFSTPSTIMKVPIAGGTPVTIASGLQTVEAIAIDATSIYWTEDTIGVEKAAK